MADGEKEEAANLQVEFEWVLHEEVPTVLKQLHIILMECARRFPIPTCSNDSSLQKQEKYMMQTSHLTTPEQVKCIATLCGDSVVHAEIQLKSQKQQNVVYRTSVTVDCPWKLQQIQDTANHLQQAIQVIENLDSDYTFRSSEEVLHMLGTILSCLQRGRTILLVPRKRTMEDLVNSKNMNSIKVIGKKSHDRVTLRSQVFKIHVMFYYSKSVPQITEVLHKYINNLKICLPCSGYSNFYASNK